MSHFYGIVKGQAKSEATRQASKKSKLYTTAASWQGCVRVALYHFDGVDMALVELAPWEGKGTRRVLYYGPVSGEGRQGGDDGIPTT